jgi:hypothetical protein
MFVISANYFDRDSAFRWLVRRAGDSTGKTVAVRSVAAKGVRFAGSDIDERGFGCMVVAMAEECEFLGIEDVADGRRIVFATDRFVDHDSGVSVAKCERLRLNSDGKIFVCLEDPSQAAHDNDTPDRGHPSSLMGRRFAEL